MQRVLVAMSGGVDSSVAAARLFSRGFDVVGVTLHLWDYPDDGSVRGRCCAPEDVHDARRVADKLGFSHYAFDRRALFEKTVVTPFVDAYLEGHTPSPCVSCNRGVKIRELLHLADRLEASFVATGHYARLETGEHGPRLLRARDRKKDQSYFLHMLPPEVLSRLRFPLGDAEKAEVRAEALRLALPGAEKGESQELCFVPTGRYDSFVEERAGGRLRPGPIVDEAGVELGRHAGIHRFTLGQRRHLGVAVGQRSYVVGLDPDTAEVRLGPQSALGARGARLADATLAPGVVPPFECDAVVRYRGAPQKASVTQGPGGALTVEFHEPVFAVVPGQYAVFYEADAVLGGGRIEASIEERRAG